MGGKGNHSFQSYLIDKGRYYRNLEGQPGIVSVYRYRSNLYVAFIHA